MVETDAHTVLAMDPELGGALGFDDPRAERLPRDKNRLGGAFGHEADFAALAVEAGWDEGEAFFVDVVPNAYMNTQRTKNGQRAGANQSIENSFDGAANVIPSRTCQKKHKTSDCGKKARDHEGCTKGQPYCYLPHEHLWRSYPEFHVNIIELTDMWAIRGHRCGQWQRCEIGDLSAWKRLYIARFSDHLTLRINKRLIVIIQHGQPFRGIDFQPAEPSGFPWPTR
ncbi:hypothetical protein [Pseudomonas sp. S2_A05]